MRPSIQRSRARFGRDGFALMAVLWMVVALAALALSARMTAREALRTAVNRREIAAARWAAEGCAERARAAAQRVVREDQPVPGTSGWNRLDRLVLGSALVDGCEVRLLAVGSRLDVNHASGEAVRRLLRAAGVAPLSADSLSDALLDWRDSDGERRPFGAEAPEYLDARTPAPRNGNFADIQEVLRVRGMKSVSGADTLLGVDSGRVALNQAPAAVLSTLPGMTPEAVARIIERRARGDLLPDLIVLGRQLSPPARSELMTHFAELNAAASTTPTGWIMTSTARVGEPPVTASVELLWVQVGARVAIVRRRGWVE